MSPILAAVKVDMLWQLTSQPNFTFVRETETKQERDCLKLFIKMHFVILIWKFLCKHMGSEQLCERGLSASKMCIYDLCEYEQYISHKYIYIYIICFPLSILLSLNDTYIILLLWVYILYIHKLCVQSLEGRRTRRSRGERERVPQALPFASVHRGWPWDASRSSLLLEIRWLVPAECSAEQLLPRVLYEQKLYLLAFPYQKSPCPQCPHR